MSYADVVLEPCVGVMIEGVVEISVGIGHVHMHFGIGAHRGVFANGDGRFGINGHLNTIGLSAIVAKLFGHGHTVETCYGSGNGLGGIAGIVGAPLELVAHGVACIQGYGYGAADVGAQIDRGRQ